ncbi:hypothetical protein KC331_g11224 [Hortaea werneckii]|nr:hypothetical protein KC331_g11224 [Hortaea werneckii]
MEPPAHNEAPASGDAVPPTADTSLKPPQVTTDVPQAAEPVATGKEQHDLAPQDEEVTAQVKSQTPGEETAGEPTPCCNGTLPRKKLGRVVLMHRRLHRRRSPEDVADHADGHRDEGEAQVGALAQAVSPAQLEAEA